MRRIVTVNRKSTSDVDDGVVYLDLHHSGFLEGNVEYTSAFIALPEADAEQFNVGESVAVDFTPEPLIANGALLPTLWQRVLSFLGLR